MGTFVIYLFMHLINAESKTMQLTDILGPSQTN